MTIPDAFTTLGENYHGEVNWNSTPATYWLGDETTDEAIAGAFLTALKADFDGEVRGLYTHQFGIFLAVAVIGYHFLEKPFVVQENTTTAPGTLLARTRLYEDEEGNNGMYYDVAMYKTDIGTKISWTPSSLT